jgi:hypothetical protein
MFLVQKLYDKDVLQFITSYNNNYYDVEKDYLFNEYQINVFYTSTLNNNVVIYDKNYNYKIFKSIFFDNKSYDELFGRILLDIKKNINETKVDTIVLVETDNLEELLYLKRENVVLFVVSNTDLNFRTYGFNNYINYQIININNNVLSLLKIFQDNKDEFSFNYILKLGNYKQYFINNYSNIISQMKETIDDIDIIFNSSDLVKLDSISNDFNIKEYQNINNDLYKFDVYKLIEHYLNYGFFEKRFYSYHQIHNISCLIKKNKFLKNIETNNLTNEIKKNILINFYNNNPYKYKIDSIFTNGNKEYFKPILKNKLCLVAVFKNESEILDEWITHYIKEGVDNFFLINNNSSDNFKSIIDKYGDIITLITDNTKHKQPILYQKHFYNLVKNYEWTIVCDLDEFIYSRNGFNTTKEYLSIVKEPCNQILIPWKMFGSNGFNTLEKKEPNSVIKHFTTRRDYINTIKIECKSIVRSKYLIHFDIHNNRFIGDTVIPDYLNTPIKNSPFVDSSEVILKSLNLHLNHYAIRSLDWFTRIKMTRGSAASVEGAIIKSKISYFYDYDKDTNFNDFELSNKVYKNY